MTDLKVVTFGLYDFLIDFFEYFNIVNSTFNIIIRKFDFTAISSI